MTSRSHRKPSTTESVVEQDLSTNEANSEEDESLPPHTSEIGTLKKLPNHGTAWLGSSSGVYFVNTVRRAFSAAFNASNEGAAVPASEDILTGDNEDGRNYNGPVTDRPSTEDRSWAMIYQALGRPPTNRKLAMELVTTFFRRWHPLFPFLHGPQLLRDTEDIYTSEEALSQAVAGRLKNAVTSTGRPLISQRKVITFQIIINLASLDRSDLHLPVESRIKSTYDVTQIAGFIATKHDMDTIQACLAAELYLVATICLRQASTVAGIILKLVYHAGLHRCPLRYAQLTMEDCEIRKRIFWSAYALDRYLSLSLGDPNTYQDSDIDVCLSGRELHKAVAKELVVSPSEELNMHLPMRIPTATPGPVSTPGSGEHQTLEINNGPQAREKQLREAAMTAYVRYGKLTGRIIEIFHKSIHARFPNQEAIIYLKSDIEDWWNQLPRPLTGEAIEEVQSSGSKNLHGQLAPFFMILYQQLLLLLNRPRLSLDQSTAEFQHGLQVCIRASRESLAALKKHKDSGQSMLLPGLFSATWMAGLIIAFACQLGKYPKIRACSDISACLHILESRRWFTIKNCHKVLSLLLENIKSRKAGANGLLSLNRSDVPVSDRTSLRKRFRSPEGSSSYGPSPKRESLGEHPSSNSNTHVSRRSENAAESTTPSIQFLPNSAVLRTASGRHDDALKSSDNFSSSLSDIQFQPDTFSQMSFPSTFDDQNNGISNAFGSALYADPSDALYAQSSHNLNAQLPDIPNLQGDDSVIWSGLDFNMPDIFGAASWEQMIGGSGSMWGDLGFDPNTDGI